MKRTLLIAGALCGALLGSAPTARAERIYKWTDSEGVLHITNIGKDGRKHGSSSSARRVADPDFKRWVPGPTAPLDFAPLDQTARFDAVISEACATYQVPPSLVRAIMNAESNFDPRAMSNKGAVGLMQLMPATGNEMAVRDINDPSENIRGGVRYLRWLTNEFGGDMVKVVAAYNAGPAAVKQAGGVPRIPETQDYVRKVIGLYFRYKGEPAR
jgi:hypothetical protein